MSDTRVPALDHTIQLTNAWLKRLEDSSQLQDRHEAYIALRSVLHVLRDRLPPEMAIHLGAQLPMLVRGLYYEGWRAAATPSHIRHIDEFAGAIREHLPAKSALQPLAAARAVFELLWTELDAGEVEKVLHALPKHLRDLWP